MEEDVVNHPNHYNQYNGFEVIDICEQLRAPDGTGNYNRGNAFKYLARAGWKNPANHIEDLEKAEFYIKREIERVKSGNWMDADPSDAAFAQMSMEETHRCPQCNTKLTPMFDGDTEFICPNHHGWLTICLNGPVWNPPATTPKSSQDLCKKNDCMNPKHEYGHAVEAVAPKVEAL